MTPVLEYDPVCLRMLDVSDELTHESPAGLHQPHAQGGDVIDALSNRCMFHTLTSGKRIFGPRLAGSMRTASISLLAFSMIGGSAHCQAVGTADEVSKGRHLAIMLC